jgi:fibronectin-binding autotransporter adhesin
MLAVDGVLGGTLTVASGGRLGGTGTVGTTTVADGGTIAPGASIGTLTVDGDIGFAAGSAYEVEIMPDGAADRIAATGTAKLTAGSLVKLQTPGSYKPGAHYTILSASKGVAGAFAGPDEDAPFVDLVLGYDANAVYLDVVRNDVEICDVVVSDNQCNTGTGIDPEGPIDGPVIGLPDVGSVQAALHLLSGEIHASVKTALVEDSRFAREAASDRVRAAFEGVQASPMPVMGYANGGFAPAAADAPLAMWMRGFGSWGTWDGNGNAAGLGRSTGGVFVGADALVAETWRLGLVAGYSHTSFDVDALTASGASDNYHLGLYGGTQWGALGLRTGLAYSWHDIETNRSVAFAGFSDQLASSYDATTFQAFGELGYRIDTAAASFEPFANLAYVELDSDAFAEQGGAAALAGQGTTTSTTFTTLGLRMAREVSFATRTATARAMLGWRHAFGDTTPLSSHAFAGANPFTIEAVPIAKDAAIIELGADLNLSNTATIGFSYNGQIANNATDHGIKADFKINF